RCRVKNRLRQPWTDVLLVPCARRGKHVETNPRRRGHQKPSQVRHFVAVGPMPAQVCLLHRVFGVSHRPKHPVSETEQAPAVRLEARGRIRDCARGAHVICSGSNAVRRQRARASPPRTRAISPSTNAAAPPTTPLPVPGPPLAIAKFSPPLTTAISPATTATIAPSRPGAVPKRLAGRARASPPMTTPTSASTTAVVAQSRRGVRPETRGGAGAPTGAASSTAYTNPPQRAGDRRAAGI